jgi:hypothetical protein
MAYMIGTGHCVVCKRLFSFHPDRVPSTAIYGDREPICRDCIERVNTIRAKRGMDLIEVLPGAYEAEKI